MKGTKQLYRNSKLFSHDFLEEHLPKLPDWQIDKDELEEALEKLQGLSQRALPATSEAALEEELIRPILGEVLGFSYLVQPSAAVFKTHRQPDYALYANDEDKLVGKALDGQKQLFENALAVADAKAWDVNLDAVGPASQMHDYVLISGVRWGLLTNGRHWRLTHRDTVHELDTFFEIDLEKLLKADDPSSLKYFLVFFRAESFRPGGFLDHVLTQSVEYAQRVGAELKENVYDALRWLCQGFLDGNSQLSPKDLIEIHENGLILLYRILFLLYAESERERELLPLSNGDYRERIGLCALKHDVADQKTWLAETHSLWSRLSDLFRLINQGSKSLKIYAYNGGLFDPQLHPRLERWQIADRYLAEALRLLACTEVEGRSGFLDYSALDVRELGSIYEGLLEHKLIHKNGALDWEKDRSQRKKTGSYYTPEYIVQYIVEQTIGPLIDEIQSGLKADLDKLDEKVHRARGENRKFFQKKKETLLRDARERVLNQKVLDPAMGSGHFLVSTCDYVARRIAELEAELTGEETEEAVQALKRTVAERCLYGVDLNPLATELAKLSLWLHTVAKGKPLSFLDHHLRTGNSLIGARVKDLERPPSGKAHEIGLWESKLVQDLAKAIGYLNFIKASASASRSDIEKKKQRWELVNAWIGKYKQAADVWLSSHFGNAVSDDAFYKILESAASNHLDELADNPALRQAREIAPQKRFFHWELEFPDVFFDKHGRRLENPGFDAVIGNPPWGAIEEKTLQEFIRVRGFEATRNNWDLYAAFVDAALALERDNGRFGMILPNTFTIGPWYKGFRETLLSKSAVDTVLNFGRLSLFEDATAFCAILLFKNECRAESRDNHRVLLIECQDLNDFLKGNLKLEEKTQRELHGDIWVFKSSIALKIEKICSPLKTFCSCYDSGMDYNKKQVAEKVFYQGAKQHPSDHPYLRGNNIERYCLVFNEHYLRWDWETLLDKSRQERLKVNRKAYLDKEKILTRQTGDRIIGALDTSQYYTQKSLHSTHLGLCCHDRFQMLFFLAVLNSPLSTYCYRELSKHEIGKPLAQIKIARLERIPIRRIGFVTPKDERARLVEEGKRLYSEALMRKNGTQTMSPEVLDALLQFVEERLEKKHRPDAELVSEHNANPLNKEWQVPEDALWEQSDVVHDLLAFLAERMIALNKQRQQKMKTFLKWLETELEIAPDAKAREGIEALTGKTRLKEFLGDYQKGEEALVFDELWEILRANKRRIGRSLTPTFMEEVRTAYEDSLAELLPLKETLCLTDGLIDQIVYRLYGLTEAEIAIVERQANARG